MNATEARAVLDQVRAGEAVPDARMMEAVRVLVAAGEMQQPAGATAAAVRETISGSAPAAGSDSMTNAPTGQEATSAPSPVEVAQAMFNKAQGVTNEEQDALIAQAFEGADSAALGQFMEEYEKMIRPMDISWVYNEADLLPGSLDDNATLARLYEFFASEEVGLIQEGSKQQLRRGPEKETMSVDAKAETVREMLYRAGGNPVVQAALRSFAQQEQIYKPTHDALQINIRYGVDLNKASTLVDLAKVHEVDPMKVAEVWKRQQARTASDPTDPHDMANVGFTKVGFNVIARRYKEGLDVYQNHLMAAVHANDPQMAVRLASDPWALDSAEIDRLLSMVDADDERYASDPQIDWLKQRRAGRLNDSVDVDTDQVKEAVRTLAESWNLMTPMDSTAQSVIREIITSTVASARAAMGNPFSGIREPAVTDVVQNISANVEARLRALPEYQMLFGNKMAAESEEEYVSRFERKSQEYFGDDLVDPVRAGMMSGNVNTVYQQGLTTDVGEDSTRFQEMLARNADTFRRFL